MTRTAVVAVMLALLPGPGRAQGQAKPRVNALTVYAGLGYVRNVSHFDVPISGINQNGLAGSLRLTWKPAHLLSMGVEVGRTDIYSVDQTLQDGSHLTSTLDAWPILIVFSMSPLRRMAVNVGTGPAIFASEVDALGNKATSSSGGSAYMASVSYAVPVGGKFALGGELRFLRLTKYEDNNLSFQVGVAYRLHEW